MTLRIFVPGDAGAVAVGADEVAEALAAAAQRRKVAIEVVRNGSRGMYWLEPLVEVQTSAGRVAYGPVTADDAEGVLTAALGDGKHARGHGLTDEIPWLKKQTRLTFARCGIVDPRSLDDYRAYGGYKGLARALELGSEATIEEVLQSGLRGRGGAGFPTGIDLTGLFWTKLCEKLSLERSLGYAEEAVQRGADRGVAPSDRSIDVTGQGCAGGVSGSRDFAAELLSLAEGIRRA